MELFFLACFYLCFPGGYIAPHGCMIAIAIAGLMRITKNIAAIFISCPYLYIQVLQVKTSCYIMQVKTGIPVFGLTCNQHGSAGAGAIEAAGRSFDHFNG